jgi:peptidoglycan/LPS O-acetylase OafA/YrhL
MPALTGIRAIAAYMVCFFHYNPFQRFEKAAGWKQLAFGFFNEMHTGVTIFFVLSGFLICYRYYETAATITWPWFKRYFLNRAARIYPMYLLITLVAFALIEWDADRYEMVRIYSQKPVGERVAAFLLNITLLKGFFNDYKFTGLAQAWSLTVEECFYFCAPFFMLGFRRSRWFFVLLPVNTLLFMLGLWLTLGQLHFHGLFGSLLFMLNFTFFGRCLEFFAGMALAVFVLRQRRQYGNVLPTHNGGWFTAASIGLFALGLLAMAMANASGVLRQVVDGIDFNSNSKDSWVGIAINNVVLPIFTVMLFYGLLTERTWLRKLLSTRLSDLLGKSSYIFYLIHIGVFNVLIRTYIAHNPMVQFVVLNILSVVLYQFVESPLHRWLKPR